MENNNASLVASARSLVQSVSTQTCVIYNCLCATDGEQAAYRILDGQLRMAANLAELEGKIKE
ncbi:MAG: hypothetical protein LUE12_06670 [Ruminococcus sp.]|nr:hypothetical protein [Ruminococcus sp.]